jgi:hypothetical protein
MYLDLEKRKFDWLDECTYYLCIDQKFDLFKLTKMLTDAKVWSENAKHLRPRSPVDFRWKSDRRVQGPIQWRSHVHTLQLFYIKKTFMYLRITAKFLKSFSTLCENSSAGISHCTQCLIYAHTYTVHTCSQIHAYKRYNKYCSALHRRIHSLGLKRGTKVDYIVIFTKQTIFCENPFYLNIFVEALVKTENG